jgi:hypothetical protein
MAEASSVGVEAEDIFDYQGKGFAIDVLELQLLLCI